VAVELLRQIHDHKLLVARGVGIGVAILWLLRWRTAPFSIAFGVFEWNWTIEHELAWLRVALFRPSGWPLSL
jgi:hypothetical protein